MDDAIGVLIKSQHPEYNDMTDADVGLAYREKYGIPEEEGLNFLQKLWRRFQLSSDIKLTKKQVELVQLRLTQQAAFEQAAVSSSTASLNITQNAILKRMSIEAERHGMSPQLYAELKKYEEQERIRLANLEKEHELEVKKAQDLAMLDYRKEAAAHLLNIKALLIADAIEKGRDLKSIATDPAWITLTKLLNPPDHG